MPGAVVAASFLACRASAQVRKLVAHKMAACGLARSPAENMKPILGVVGGIGSGKSFVAAELTRYGGRLIDADALGHEALRDDAIKKQVVARWGKDVLGADGEIQRRPLGRLVFANPAELKALEAMVFP